MMLMVTTGLVRYLNLDHNKILTAGWVGGEGGAEPQDFLCISWGTSDLETACRRRPGGSQHRIGSLSQLAVSKSFGDAVISHRY